MTKAIQVKSVADDAILAIIDETRRSESRWTFAWDIEAALAPVPPKVVRAKLKSMIRRGVITGCACGCRGDLQRPEQDIDPDELAAMRTPAVRTAPR